MSARPLVILPDQRLKLVSTPVETVDDEVRALVSDMLHTMYEAPGIGLAAIQVGVPKRIVTIDLSKDAEKRTPVVMINPEIVWSSEETKVWEEGCLSIPEYYDEVERPDRVRVKYLNFSGEPREIEADGLFSVCIQHEIDHLNGVLFIDHLSKLKRDRCVKKFTKAARLREAEG